MDSLNMLLEAGIQQKSIYCKEVGCFNFARTKNGVCAKHHNLSLHKNINNNHNVIFCQYNNCLNNTKGLTTYCSHHRAKKKQRVIYDISAKHSVVLNNIDNVEQYIDTMMNDLTDKWFNTNEPIIMSNNLNLFNDLIE